MSDKPDKTPKRSEATVAARPSLLDILSPRYLFAAFTEFLSGWLSSRSAIALKVALPAMVAVLVVFGCLIWMTQADRNETLAALETRLAKATKDNDLVAQRVCLNALCARAPDVPEYRFNLAMSYAEEGKAETARAVVTQLAKQHPTFASGHLWLANFEIQRGRPGIERAINHFQRVLENDPNHAITNAQLGQLYMRLGQPMLAEDPLRKAAEELPEAALMLSNMWNQSGKPVEAARLARQTATKFRQLVAKDPSNVELRIRWAEALRLNNRNSDAERAIEDGLALGDDPRLRTALSDLVVLSLQDELSRGIADGDRNEVLIQRAFHVAPTNLRAIQSLCQLATTRFVQCEPEELQAAVETLQTRLVESETRSDRLMLGWLRYLQKNGEEALAAIEAVAADGGPLEKLQLAILHSALGNETASEATADLAEKVAADQLKQDRSIANAIQLVRVYLFEEKSDDAVTLLDSFADEDDKSIRQMIASVRLRQFDKLRSTDGVAADKLIAMATEVKTRIGRSDPAYVTRLSTLADDKSNVAEWANKELRDLLAAGVQPGLIRSILGTHALQAEKYDEASTHLEFAFRAANRDPVISNNLAFALTMREKPDHRRAVELATQALELMPKHPQVLETRARAFLGLKRYDEAVADLQFALPSAPDKKKIHKLLATAYERLGNSDMSVRHRELSEGDSA